MLMSRTQRGLTLIELMVGIVVSMIVIAGAIAVYVTSARSGGDAVRLARLNQDARAIMDVVGSELRRTGYCWPQFPATFPNRSPQCASPAEQNIVIEAGGTCVRYFYERLQPDDGGYVQLDSTAFRFDANSGTISVRMGGAITAACNTGTWVALNDPATARITDFTISTVDSQCLNTRVTPTASWVASGTNPVAFPCESPATFGATVAAGDRLFETRQVTLNLELEDAADSSFTIAMQEVVKLRNNRITTVP